MRFCEFNGNYKVCKINEIANVVGGGTPDTLNEKFWNGGINWFTPTEIGHKKYVTISNRTISTDGLNNSSAKILPVGSILFSSRATIGEVSINLIETATNQGFQSLVINNENSNEYIYYLIQTLKKHFIKKACGSTFPEISNSEVSKTKICIPKIQEQYKIAKFFSLLAQRIDTQSKIIEDLELCKKKICYEIFSAKESYVKPLGSIISYGKAGGTPASTNKSYYNGNIPFLSISDMTEQGKYILKTEKTLSELGLKNSSAWLVPKNSLILSMYASVGFVSISKVELATSQAMFSMIIEDKNLLEYVYYYLNYFKSFKIHRLLETGTQSNINAEMVKNINIPFYN